MCEYAHAMGNGPGALDTYDAQVDASPRHHGGFVWEWRDHGLLTHTADGTPFFAYGGDFGEVVHDGNFVMDGMVLPDDTPTPGLAEFAAVNAPVVLDRRSIAGRLTVANRYHTVDTAHLRFVAVVEDDGAPRVRDGAGACPPCPRRAGSVDAARPPGLDAGDARRDLGDGPRRAGRRHAVGGARARRVAHPVRRRTPRATVAPRHDRCAGRTRLC